MPNTGTTGTERRFADQALRFAELEGDVNTASATAGAATLNAGSGVVTSESITTAAAATYSLTVTNNMVAAADIVLASVFNGSNTTGAPVVSTVTPAAGTFTAVVRNNHATDAFGGTIKIGFLLVKQQARSI